MRTTVTIDDSLIEEAIKASGETNTSALVEMALRNYLRTESTKRLLKLAGKAPTFTVPERSSRASLRVAEDAAEYGDPEMP